MKRAVFLDRDGVINEVTFRDGVSRPPADVREFSFLPGVKEASRELVEAGFVLFVITNQPDVARGMQTRERVEEMNGLVARELPVCKIFTCFHDDRDECDCRKPRPGMITKAAEEWGLVLKESYVVGDRWSDVEAGRAAGCKTVFIERGYGHKERCVPDWVAANLREAASIICRQRG